MKAGGEGRTVSAGEEGVLVCGDFLCATGIEGRDLTVTERREDEMMGVCDDWGGGFFSNVTFGYYAMNALADWITWNWNRKMK